MINKLRITTLCILSAGIIGACAPAFRQVPTEFSEGVSRVEVFDAEVAAVEAPAAEPSAGISAQALPSERLVIRNVDLSITVSDPAEATQSISGMAEEMGGFVVSSNVYKTTFDGDIEADLASITIRVPAERLDEALDRIKADAIEVRSENISGQDVTEEYTDLQSRLRNLEALDEELREFLRAATKTEDALRVFEHLERVRADIELIKGRIQYLTDSARLSAISVDLLPDVAERPLQIGRWQPQGTAKAAFEALLRTLKGIADFTIWLIIYILPVVIVIALPLGLLYRVFRRFRPAKRKRATPPEKENETPQA
ncbi:MAG: DUF4349 domain-containing protein [Anaerolineales bacterium]|nr:DUF4349 domain-containing protein [Anaerolineales bacterium]